MLNALLKILVISILFATFLGQAMADDTSDLCNAAVDASLINDAQQIILNNSIPADPNKRIPEAKDCCDIECCNADCLCIASTCSPVVYLNTQVDDIPPLLFSEKMFSQPLRFTKTHSSLVYRPPIFIS